MPFLTVLNPKLYFELPYFLIKLIIINISMPIAHLYGILSAFMRKPLLEYLFHAMIQLGHFLKKARICSRA